MLLATDEHVMMLAVRDWLTEQFAAAELQPEAGAEAVLKRDILPDPDDMVGGPQIALSLQNDVRSQWAGANGRGRDCTINVECRANDFADSIVGAENPHAAHVQMARAIRGFDANEIEGAIPGLTTIQTLSENGHTVLMRLFLTYNEN